MSLALVRAVLYRSGSLLPVIKEDVEIVCPPVKPVSACHEFPNWSA